jgi:hypothetical protein
VAGLVRQVRTVVQINERSINGSIPLLRSLKYLRVNVRVGFATPTALMSFACREKQRQFWDRKDWPPLAHPTN